MTAIVCNFQLVTQKLEASPSLCQEPRLHLGVNTLAASPPETTTRPAGAQAVLPEAGGQEEKYNFSHKRKESTKRESGHP